MVRAALPVALMLAFAFAGCTGSEQPQSAHEFEESFDSIALGTMPAGWTATGGSWKVASNATSPDGAHVLQGEGIPDGRVSLLADGAGDAVDFTATVRFNLVSGEHPQGAGLSFNYVDDMHYGIVRYSSSEENWHLFLADGEPAEKYKDATVAGHGLLHPLGEWITLKVVAKDGHLSAYDGTTLVIDWQLPSTITVPGGVGLFLRGSTVAQFDGFEFEPEA